MDAAKWVHWNGSLPLWQVPSLPSVNACFTHMVAVRDETGVHYSADAIPEMVFVDFDLMREAPAHLLRGGIGDVFTCHTARWDWEYAVARGHDPAWDEFAAAESLRIIERAARCSRPRSTTSPTTARRVSWSCIASSARCATTTGTLASRRAREHFFAYCFEFVNGHTIMHGEIGSLGVLIMSAIQGNRPESPARSWRRPASGTGPRSWGSPGTRSTRRCGRCRRSSPARVTGTRSRTTWS